MFDFVSFIAITIIYLFIDLSLTYTRYTPVSLYPSMFLSIYLSTYLSIYLYNYLPIHFPFCLSINQIYLPSNPIFLYFIYHPSLNTYIYLPICVHRTIYRTVDDLYMLACHNGDNKHPRPHAVPLSVHS